MATTSPVFFSIVMPAFNAAHTLPAAVDSLLRQSHAEFELLIVDDCSTDATPALAEAYAASDARVRALRMPRNSGVSACSNEGVRRATHDWLGIVDADAVVPENWLATAEEVARQGYDLFGGPCDYFQPRTRIERVFFAFEEDVTGKRAEVFDRSHAREPLIRGTNLFLTREMFERVGGFAEKIRAAQDRLFICNAIESGGRVFHAPRLVVGHPLPAALGEYLRRKDAIERWRLLAAERSPILRQVYRPIYPVLALLAGALAIGIGTLGLACAILAAMALAAAGFAVAVIRAMTRRLSLVDAILYVAIDIYKKACTVFIYVLKLKPKGVDWKARVPSATRTTGGPMP